MQGPVRRRAAASAIAIAIVVLAGGCATSLRVAFDERHDFSGYRTFGFGPHVSSVVDGAPGEEQTLDTLTARLVERELEGRGLVRERGEADLLVTYTLRVRRYLVSVSETGAEILLASHHSSPSYLIQATQSRRDVYYDAVLVVVVRDRERGDVVWQGELRARHKDDFARNLPASIAQLLARLPRAGPADQGLPPTPAPAS
jgi:hypothetical protein